MKMKKRIISVLSAFVLAVAPLSAFVASARGSVIHDVMQDTRYNPYSPVIQALLEYTVNPSDNVIFSEAIGIISYGIGTAADVVVDNVHDALSSPDRSGGLARAVAAQRALDLVEYAKMSTGQPSTLPSSYAFVAKRRILYPSGVSEVDYLYYWGSDDTTLHSNPFKTGVTLGDFYLTPNSFVCFRAFSTGETSAFYGSCLDFPVRSYADKDYRIIFGRGNYTVYNQDGVAETCYINTNYTLRPIIFGSSAYTADFTARKNSITTLELLNMQSQDSERFNKFWSEGRIFTNIECMTSNVWNQDGAPMFLGNRRYRDDNSNLEIGEWTLSSGAFFGTRFNQQLIDNNFNTDVNNIDPVKSPAYYVPRNPLDFPHMLTPQNVQNFYDYGITYDTENNTYDIDPSLLLAGVGAMVQPQIEPIFDGTFDAQPEINGNFSGELPLDVNNDFELGLKDLLETLKPSPPWEPPTYPPVSTDPLVSYTYPVLPTETVPQNVLDDVGTVVGIGFDTFDTLGTAIMGTLIALAVLGAVSYYIWG